MLRHIHNFPLFFRILFRFYYSGCSTKMSETLTEKRLKKRIQKCHANILRNMSIEYGFRKLEMYNAALLMDFQRIKGVKDYVK
jgi:hypothetical protein